MSLPTKRLRGLLAVGLVGFVVVIVVAGVVVTVGVVDEAGMDDEGVCSMCVYCVYCVCVYVNPPADEKGIIYNSKIPYFNSFCGSSSMRGGQAFVAGTDRKLNGELGGIHQSSRVKCYNHPETAERVENSGKCQDKLYDDMVIYTFDIQHLTLDIQHSA